MKILALDLAKNTGWAVGDGSFPAWGHFILPKQCDDVAPYLLRAERHFNRLVLDHKPDMIAYEAQLLMAKRDSPLKLQHLYGLANEVEKAAYRANKTPCRQATLGDIRTHFLGRNYPKDTERVKIATKVKCRSLGWDVETDDEADALAVLSYMLAIEKPNGALAVTPLFQKRA